MKNVREPVELFAAVTRGEDFARGYPMDPVCRMAVDTAHVSELEEFRGREYRFCSAACHEAFARILRITPDDRDTRPGEIYGFPTARENGTCASFVAPTAGSIGT